MSNIGTFSVSYPVPEGAPPINNFPVTIDDREVPDIYDKSRIRFVVKGEVGDNYLPSEYHEDDGLFYVSLPTLGPGTVTVHIIANDDVIVPNPWEEAGYVARFSKYATPVSINLSIRHVLNKIYNHQ